MSRFSPALFMVLLSMLAAVGSAQQQDPKAKAPTAGKPFVVTVGDGGTGPYKAILFGDPSLPTHTVYRPKDLAPFGKGNTLPIVLWGNGSGLSSSGYYRRFLTEIASHGFLVVANGPAETAAKEDKRDGGNPKSSELLDGLNWAIAQDAKDGDYRGKIDTKKVAAMGHSLGGTHAMEVSPDPRITTTILWNSGAPGAKSKFSRDDLEKLHKPVAYIIGGPMDSAFKGAEETFQAIKNVPVFYANRDVGHAGTFAQTNGGAFAVAGVAWLKWHLKGDKEAAKMFLGNPPGLAADKAWTVNAKNLK